MGLSHIQEQAIIYPKYLLIDNCTNANKIQWNFNQNTIIFKLNNPFENAVCKM